MGIIMGDRRRSQASGYLCGARTVCLGNLVKHFAGNFTCSEWIPRNKSNSIALTIIHYVVPFAVRKAIAVLDGDDRNDFARPARCALA